MFESKSTKLVFALKGQVLHWILGLVPKKWLLFTVNNRVIDPRDWNCAEIARKCQKRQNSGNTSMKVAETPAGNQQRETVHGPPFYVAELYALSQNNTNVKFDL